jgi:hypothetical protein
MLSMTRPPMRMPEAQKLAQDTPEKVDGVEAAQKMAQILEEVLAFLPMARNGSQIVQVVQIVQIVHVVHVVHIVRTCSFLVGCACSNSVGYVWPARRKHARVGDDQDQKNGGHRAYGRRGARGGHDDCSPITSEES